MTKRLTTTLALAAMLCFSANAFSAGFLIMEQSVSALGNAYAGAAATAEDATTVFFNPAGLSKLCSREIVIAGHGIWPVAKFHNHDSFLSPFLNPPNFTPIPLRGGNGKDAGVKAFVGNLYYSQPLPCGFTFGLGVNAPFGLTTDYGDNWVGRYFASYSKLWTININPSLAYRINDCLSVGVGFSAQYAKADLRNAVDFGSILFAASHGEAGVPQEMDGKAKVTGHSWGYGFNVGALWDITPCTRVGIHYRSDIKHDIEGEIHFKNVPDVLNGTFVSDVDAKAKIHFPQTLSLSAIHHINSCWSILGDITWTKWDVIKRLRIQVDSPEPDIIVPLKWRNAMRYSIAANYRPCERLVLRSGLAYDQSPVRNKHFATPRIPDSDRIWTTLGAGYDVTEWLHIDVAYAHLFPRRPKINKTENVIHEDDIIDNPEFFSGGLRGSWSTHVNIVSLQAVFKF